MDELFRKITEFQTLPIFLYIQALHLHQALSLKNALLNMVFLPIDIELTISMFKTQVNFRNSVHLTF